MTLVLIIRGVLRYLFRSLAALCKHPPDTWWEMERQETRLFSYWIVRVVHVRVIL